MKLRQTYRKLAILLAASAFASARQGNAQALGLKEALNRVRIGSPALQIALQEVSIQKDLGKQSILYPNPEIAGEVENVSGSGAAEGFNEGEYTVFVSQAFPLGGRRGKQKRVAALEQAVVLKDYELAKREVIAEATKAFYDALAAQEHVALARELEILTAAFVTDAERRAHAGAASVIEVAKAEIEQAEVQIQRMNAKRQYELSRLTLSMQWGGASPDFTQLEGSLDHLATLPDMEELTVVIGSHPAILRADDMEQQRAAELSRVRAARFSDLELGAGMKRYEQTGDHALLVGLAVPLPLWDRKQGDSDAARQEVHKAGLEAQTTRLRVLRELQRVHTSMSATRSEALTLRDFLLPVSQKAYDATREGYLQGRFGYLDVLDAERTLFAQRTRYINVLLAHQHARADLQRLMAPTEEESEIALPEEKR